MRRETFVFLSIILLTVARAADVAVTYRFSPDLAFEGNPMVKLFGMGWTFMLCANLIAVSALGVCSVYFLRNPIRYESSAVVNDVWSFASFASFNRVYSRKMFLCKRFFCTPKRGKHTLHLFTVVAPPVLIVLSVVAVFSWFAMYLFHWESFCRFYKATWPVFPYVIAIPLVWTVTAVFYKNEFQRYSRENSSLDVSADDAGKSGNDEFVPLSQ